MTLHQKARRVARKALRKCGLIWSSHESRYIEIMAEALMEFRKEELRELKSAIEKDHIPMCAFCGDYYGDNHTEKWPIPRCSCPTPGCKLAQIAQELKGKR